MWLISPNASMVYYILTFYYLKLTSPSIAYCNLESSIVTILLKFVSNSHLILLSLNNGLSILEITKSLLDAIKLMIV